MTFSSELEKRKKSEEKKQAALICLRDMHH